MIKRAVIFVHRWLGVALCLFFLLWFPSGIGMMYWDFPGVTAADRLEHAAALEASAVHLSPADAYAVSGLTQPPSQVRLNTFDGRPVYRFRAGRSETIVYADTGERQREVTSEMRARAAAAWGRTIAGAREASRRCSRPINGRCRDRSRANGRSRSSRGRAESRSTSATPRAKWCSTRRRHHALAPTSDRFLTGSTSPRCASTSSPGTASSPGRPASARLPRFSASSSGSGCRCRRGGFRIEGRSAGTRSSD